MYIFIKRDLPLISDLDFLSPIMLKDIFPTPMTTQTQKYNKTDILSILRKLLQRMCGLNQ